MTDERKKGFAALDSMVSSVETSSATAETLKKVEVVLPVQAAQSTVYVERTPTDRGSPIKWVLGIGFGAFLIWVFSTDGRKSSPPPAPRQNFATPSVAPSYTPSGTSSNTPTPSLTYTSTDEQRPPVGQGLVLDRPQIRYCASQDIRLTSWKEAVNQYSSTSVNAFNQAINDYNSRCSNFRYRKGQLEGVRSEVERNRVTLELEGLTLSSNNP